MKALNLFYEPAAKQDVCFPLDRYLQRAYRFIRRGRSPSGPTRGFRNLCAGLTQLGVRYRINDYEHAKNNPAEIACVFNHSGLSRIPLRNPVLYGPNVIEYPADDLRVLNRYCIPRILVFSEWQRQLYESAWGERLTIWPVGIDTDKWAPSEQKKDIDLLIYDKLDNHILFYEEGENTERNRKRYKDELLRPILRYALQRRLKTVVIRYGFYREAQFHSLLRRSKGMIFLSKSETQGFAYLQALSTNVAVMAWDEGESWRERATHQRLGAKRSRVTSVPYWDDRCGVKFKNAEDFTEKVEGFLATIQNGGFAAREYILEHLTLRQRAENYLNIWQTVQENVNGPATTIA